MKQGWGKWLPVIVWLGVIFVGSSISNVPKFDGPILDGWSHRVGHVAEYAVLAWLLMRALSNDPLVTRRVVVLTLIIVVLYGISDEFHQRFTPGRNSELIAVVWDMLGGAVGAAVWVWRAHAKAKRRAARQLAE